MMFSERLNPVNPKAQKKVPVPKASTSTNPSTTAGTWTVKRVRAKSTARRTVTQSTEAAVGRGGARHDKDGRKKEKERSSRDKKRSTTGRSGLYSDDDYNAPLTAEDKAEAKRRLEARKQAQMSDPFYLVDRRQPTQRRHCCMETTPESSS